MTARWVYRLPWHAAIFTISCAIAGVPLWFAVIGLLMDVASFVNGGKSNERSFIHAIYITLAGIPAAFLLSVLVWFFAPIMDACTPSDTFPSLWLKVASHFCQRDQAALADKYISALATHWALMPIIAIIVAYAGGNTNTTTNISSKKLALNTLGMVCVISLLIYGFWEEPHPDPYSRRSYFRYDGMIPLWHHSFFMLIPLLSLVIKNSLLIITSRNCGKP